MKRLLAALAVLAVPVLASAIDAPISRGAHTEAREARPLLAYHVTKLDPLSDRATMDTQGIDGATPYMAGSTGRYGDPKGPIGEHALRAPWAAGSLSGDQAAQVPDAWRKRR